MITSYIKHLFPVLFILSLSSCFKSELPVPEHNPGNTITQTVNMGKDYRTCYYYSLQNNVVVSQNLKTDWDIAFEASTNGFHIFLNTGKSMFAMRTGKTSMSAITIDDTTGFGANKHWDSPKGEIDSTAIGDWRSGTGIYILDRGYDVTGLPLGFEMLNIKSVSDSGYWVEFGAIGGGSTSQLFIKKDTTYNAMYLSFEGDGSIKSIEPPKHNWDIVFTQYTEVFYDPIMPYEVTGVLMNKCGITVAVDSLHSFEDLKSNNISSLKFSTNIDAIGYSWKAYNGTKYTVNPRKCYVIKNAENVLYKLHFIDFYDNAGNKGNPKWEMVRL